MYKGRWPSLQVLGSKPQVTQILQEEVQRFPSIANIGVTVSTKAVTIEAPWDVGGWPWHLGNLRTFSGGFGGVESGDDRLKDVPR